MIETAKKSDALKRSKPNKRARVVTSHHSCSVNADCSSDFQSGALARSFSGRCPNAGKNARAAFRGTRSTSPIQSDRVFAAGAKSYDVTGLVRRTQAPVLPFNPAMKSSIRSRWDENSQTGSVLAGPPVISARSEEH